jgi:hypothetical protein
MKRGGVRAHNAAQELREPCSFATFSLIALISTREPIRESDQRDKGGFNRSRTSAYGVAKLPHK